MSTIRWYAGSGIVTRIPDHVWGALDLNHESVRAAYAMRICAQQARPMKGMLVEMPLAGALKLRRDVKLVTEGYGAQPSAKRRRVAQLYLEQLDRFTVLQRARRELTR